MKNLALHSVKISVRRSVLFFAWWKSAIGGAWLAVIVLYWYTLPLSFRTKILSIVELPL
jgi:hypothetical protein